MAMEDEQFDELLCLLEKQEQFADHLMDLATQLEETTKTMTKGQLVGNTTTVLGSLALVGIGISISMSGGLVAPLLVKGASYMTLGGTVVSLTYKILDIWKSSKAMKNAKKTANEIEEICEKGLSSDKVESKIATVILKTMVKAAVKKGAKKGAKYAVQKAFKSAAAKEAISTLQMTGEGISVALKTMSKGAGQTVGGALGLVFTLPELIDNCESLIKDKHETEASKYLRTTANEIRDAVKELRKQEKMLDETSDTE